MSIPCRWAARMIVSPFSNGTSRPSILIVSAMSVIALAADHVDRAERGDDVGDHRAGDELREPLGDGEAGRADAHPVRRAAAVGDEVEAELPVAGLGVRVALARGDLDALHHDLE